MKNQNSTDSQGAPDSETPQKTWQSPWQLLKSKNISYLTIPLLVMATVVEYVILATGFKYQQTVCLPQGMGVTFFGIGPIGATILAVELLKLPLAVWTASRIGWQKGAMMMVGLPLICLLTFQLVKDMAVYEMGVAMTPAGQMLEKASAEETKIVQLNGDLAAIEKKRANREQTLAELAARKAKAKADLEESLKHNEDTRKDAISLTEYQQKELSEVEARQATIIKQFDADSAQLTKGIAELRARREVEVGRATTWNAEEARLENAFKAKMAEYTNKKATYVKDKAEYESANFLKRQLMKEPVDPGVPPAREDNAILKPTLIAQIDAQIKDKEAELAAVNNKRRERVAQVDSDARHLREEFDRRSGTKREETDRKREELLVAQAALDAQFTAEEKKINEEFQSAVLTIDGIRAEIGTAQKKAEGYYEAREASIKNTQVHRIATTVEIIRGLLKGERPVSVTSTAKARGDLYTDQIAMVRIWVYPVLAFIVAFLPTLMVEIGFSTLFKPEQQRPQHRLGFFGRRMHALYIRAGRLKVLRAERMAREVSTKIASRDEALAVAQANAEQALVVANATAEKELYEKDLELQAAHEAIYAATANHKEQLTEQVKKKEEEWVAKLAAMADSLNRAIIEKDALRDLQKSEIERQIQMRQNAWSDRITQLRQELDEQRTAAEAERTALIQEQHKKLKEVSEVSKAQVIQARRQVADAELASVENNAKLEHDLKAALNVSETAETQLQQQTETLSLKLSQAREDAAREMDKAARQEKHRLELKQSEFAKTLRQREEDFGHQLAQHEQELSLAFEARLLEEKDKAEQNMRRRESEIERQIEARASEVDLRWKQEVQQREDAAQIRLKQREQQLQAQAETHLGDMQTQAEQESRLQKVEFERQLEAQSREADARLREELQQKELTFHARLKQREQELNTKAAARETELQNQWVSDMRVREEEWESQAESRVNAFETRLSQEAKQKEETFKSQLRQRDQQWQVKLDAIRDELKTQAEQELRTRELESADARHRALSEIEARLRKEMRQKDEIAQVTVKQREQELIAQLTARAEARQMAAQAQWETDSEQRIRAATEPLKTLLARTEKERDEARLSADGAVSHVQDLEEKLTEASSFLSRWKNGNGKNVVIAGR